MHQDLLASTRSRLALLASAGHRPPCPKPCCHFLHGSAIVHASCHLLQTHKHKACGPGDKICGLHASAPSPAVACFTVEHTSPPCSTGGVKRTLLQLDGRQGFGYGSGTAQERWAMQPLAGMSRGVAKVQDTVPLGPGGIHTQKYGAFIPQASMPETSHLHANNTMGGFKLTSAYLVRAAACSYSNCDTHKAALCWQQHYGVGRLGGVGGWVGGSRVLLWQ